MNTNKFTLPSIVIATSFGLMLSSPHSRAQFTLASDNASNYGGTWNNGSDQGTGFGGWGLSTNGGNGSFIGSPASAGVGTGNGLTTTAFGLYSYQQNGYFNAGRGLDSGLQVGDTFSFVWGMNWDAGNGSKGFDLKSGGSVIFTVNNGGSSTITAGGNNAFTSFGTTPMIVTVTRTSGSQYSFDMTARDGGSSYSTTINSSSSIDNFNLYIGNQQDNPSDQRNIYFNAFTVTNNGVFSTTRTISSALTGGGALVTSNGATVTLTSDGNTFTGGSTVQSGTTLKVGGGGGTGDLSGNVANSGNVTFDRTGSLAYDGVVSGTGSLTKSGAGTVILTGANSTSGGNTVSAGTLQIGNGGTAGSIAGTISVDGTLAYNRSDSVTQSGAISGNGNVAQNGGATLTLDQANDYTGETQINNGTIALTGSLNSASMIYVGSGGNASNAALSLSGTTTLANNIQINVSSGSGTRDIIKADATSQIASGNITNNRNSTINVAEAGGNLNLSGVLSGGSALTKTGSGTLVLSGSSDNSLSGAVSVSAGTLVLNKTSGDAIDGSVTVASGALLTNAAAHQINDAESVTINSGGTWALGGNNETVGSLDVDGTLALGTAQVIVNGDPVSFIKGWSGTVSGASGSSLVFKAMNTFISGNNTGLASGSAIYVVGGRVGFNHNNAAGSATLYLGETFGTNNAMIESDLSGITMGNDIVVRSGSSGNRTIDNATTSGSRAITFNGGVDLQDTVFVTSSDLENVTFGGVISNSGSIVKQGAGTMTLGAVNTMSGGVYVDDGTLTVAAGGDLTAASNVTIGSTNYNGGNSAAALHLASGAAGLDRTINVASGAGARTLSSAGNNNITGAINQSGNLTLSNTTGTLSVDDVTMNTSGDNDLAVAGAGNVSIGGTITASSGASAVNKAGAGTLTISGNNSGQSYMLNIGGGKVVLDNANALGTSYGDKVNFTGNSTLNAAANISPASLGLRVGNGITGTIEVNNGNNLSAATLGSVSGTGTFNKTGTGTLTLTGTSTVANANNVNAGTLFVSSGASLAGTTTVSGGTLAGSGSVGATTIASGGTISPGNSPGTLSLTNGLTWEGGGNYNWQIFDATSTAGTGWDLIAVSGDDWDFSALNSGSKFNINLWSLSSITPDANGSAINFDPTQNYRWEILTYTTLDGSTNNLADLFNINATALNGTGGFQNSLSNGSFSLEIGEGSLDLLFTAFSPNPSPAVPEPGTWAAAALLTGAAAYVRLRRRKDAEPKA